MYRIPTKPSQSLQGTSLHLQPVRTFSSFLDTFFIFCTLSSMPSSTPKTENVANILAAPLRLRMNVSIGMSVHRQTCDVLEGRCLNSRWKGGKPLTRNFLA